VSGPYKMMGNPIKFTKTPVTPTWGAPALGEHSSEVLQSIGYDEETIETLKKQAIIK